jgi:hypothetical protein
VFLFLFFLKHMRCFFHETLAVCLEPSVFLWEHRAFSYISSLNLNTLIPLSRLWWWYMASRFSVLSQNGNLNISFHFHATSLSLQDPLVTNNLLALGPPPSPSLGSQGFGAPILNSYRRQRPSSKEDEIPHLQITAMATIHLVHQVNQLWDGSSSCCSLIH